MSVINQQMYSFPNMMGGLNSGKNSMAIPGSGFPSNGLHLPMPSPHMASHSISLTPSAGLSTTPNDIQLVGTAEGFSMFDQLLDHAYTQGANTPTLASIPSSSSLDHHPLPSPIATSHDLAHPAQFSSDLHPDLDLRLESIPDLQAFAEQNWNIVHMPDRQSMNGPMGGNAVSQMPQGSSGAYPSTVSPSQSVGTNSSASSVAGSDGEGFHHTGSASSLLKKFIWNTRSAKVARYKQKRDARRPPGTRPRRPVYESRRELAARKPRIKGRFAKVNESPELPQDDHPLQHQHSYATTMIPSSVPSISLSPSITPPPAKRMRRNSMAAP
eukprot:GILK01014711.1.p1 GENE.GILK01014711.1~~GILK01014711.1.p1  ORF type:complete len:327 (+),score=16.27 GILK01014711.1:175-1155(+)